MTRNEARSRALRLRRRRQAVILAGLVIVAGTIIWARALIPATEAACMEDKPAEPEIPAITQLDTPEAFRPAQEPYAAECLARTVWGEARGCSTTEQAAVAWCILNRLDSTDPFYASCDSVYDIVSQPDQFDGWDPAHPIKPEILAVCQDVLFRWSIEKECVGDVGRVLPKEYLFFTGDGKENVFTTEWRGGETWDWSIDSPYEEVER